MGEEKMRVRDKQFRSRLSHVLVDCGLRGVAFAGGYGGFCQIKIAPLYPNSRKDHDFGGKN